MRSLWLDRTKLSHCRSILDLLGGVWRGKVEIEVCSFTTAHYGNVMRWMGTCQVTAVICQDMNSRYHSQKMCTHLISEKYFINLVLLLKMFRWVNSAILQKMSICKLTTQNYIFQSYHNHKTNKFIVQCMLQY